MEQINKSLCVCGGQTINKIKPVESIAFVMATHAKEENIAGKVDWKSWGWDNCNFRQNIQERRDHLGRDLKRGNLPADFWGKIIPGRRSRMSVRSEMSNHVWQELIGMRWLAYREATSTLIEHLFTLGSCPMEPIGRPLCVSPRLPLPIGPQLEDYPASLLIFGSVLVRHGDQLETPSPL